MSSHSHKKPFFKRTSTYIYGAIALIILFVAVPFATGANRTKATPNYFTTFKTDLQKTIKDSSVLESNDIGKVSGQNGAKVSELLVNVGGDVTAGQVVARLDQNGKTIDLTAPIAGTVVKLNYQAGENLGQSELLQIADNSSYRITSTVSTNEIASVKADQTVKVKIKTLDSEKDYDAKVENVQNYAHLTTSGDYSSTYQVRIKLSEKPVGAVTGMKANVVIYGDKKDNALVVENNLIFQKADGSKYVKLVDWINKDQNLFTLRDTKITTGLENDKYTEVLTGLNEGDQITTPTDTSKPTGPSFLPRPR
jgi:multidrug efflux pump subunit AcrA (membrane-fusion protein)